MVMLELDILETERLLRALSTYRLYSYRDDKFIIDILEHKIRKALAEGDEGRDD